MPCGEKEHIILLPPKGKYLESPDMLVHELGHAAEYTLRRTQNDDRLLIQHRLLSETVAHYCQYKYLIHYGSIEQRIGAIGSITKEYLTLQAVLAAIEYKQEIINIENIVEHELLSDFVSLYGKNTVSKILSTYGNRKIAEIYHYFVEPRFGAFIALRLLDRVDAIKDICVTLPDRPIKETLSGLGLDSDILLDFSCANDLIQSFIQGNA